MDDPVFNQPEEDYTAIAGVSVLRALSSEALNTFHAE